MHQNLHQNNEKKLSVLANNRNILRIFATANSMPSLLIEGLIGHREGALHYGNVSLTRRGRSQIPRFPFVVNNPKLLKSVRFWVFGGLFFCMGEKTSVCFWKNLSDNRTAIMGMSMISIILFHQHFISVFPCGIFHRCGYWGVDVFLLLSGMGVFSSYQAHSLSTFYQRRFMRIIPSCLACGMIKCMMRIIIEGPESLSHIGISELFCMDLWFVRAIIFYYAISPVIIVAIKKNASITIMLIAVIYLINGLFFRTHDALSFTWIVERVFVFSLGILLASKQELVNHTATSLSSVSFCLAFCFALITEHALIISSQALNTLFMFAVAIGTVGLLQIGNIIIKHAPLFIIRVLVFCGKLSLEIYLVHEYLFFIVMEKIKINNSPLAFLLSISLALAIAFICKSFINKMKTLK